jgi:hypothetical protein
MTRLINSRLPISIKKSPKHMGIDLGYYLNLSTQFKNLI